MGDRHAKQIHYWLHTMQDRNEIKGEAKQCPLSALAEQVAFHAKYWSGKKSGDDPVSFAIFVACQKIRAGTWSVPFELAKAREAILRRQSQTWQKM